MHLILFGYVLYVGFKIIFSEKYLSSEMIDATNIAFSTLPYFTIIILKMDDELSLQDFLRTSFAGKCSVP